MELNADFAQRAVVHAAQHPWRASPVAGVDRRMLDRLGDEVARATSIVRFAPGGSFTPHTHDGGEEFLVLEGVFQDEHGDFPVGSYVRNPPQSSHKPGSDAGCVIFVKLWQFDADDRRQVHVDTSAAAYQPVPGQTGVRALELFEDSFEQVSMQIWQAGATVSVEARYGLELLVVEGGFEEDGGSFQYQSWLRLPPGSKLTAKAGPEGAKVWMKRNHLKKAPQPPGG